MVTPATALRTGASNGVANCRICNTSMRAPKLLMQRERWYCPVCRTRVRLRRPQSLQRAWALLLTAVICYVPANVYPIMTVVHFGYGEPDTILTGIVHLAADGQWPIAALVFLASIVVPVVKIAGLAFLLASVHGRWRWRPRGRARLLHIIHAIGRWSMIDIFMISILVALVRLGAVASVVPGPGAAFFAAVVLTTMFAAITFDERLLWDAEHD